MSASTCTTFHQGYDLLPGSLAIYYVKKQFLQRLSVIVFDFWSVNQICNVRSRNGTWLAKVFYNRLESCCLHNPCDPIPLIGFLCDTFPIAPFSRHQTDAVYHVYVIYIVCHQFFA